MTTYPQVRVANPGAPYLAPEAGADPRVVVQRAARAFLQLQVDRGRLDKCDRYHRGEQDKPYYPTDASRETKELAEKSITNWMPLLVNVPTQVSLVEGMWRAGSDDPEEFRTWDQNRMDSRQTSLYRSAATYGQSFCAVDVRNRKKIKLRSLSPLNTTAFYDDPGSDIFPRFALSILERPTDEANPGRAIYWDDTIQCELVYDLDGKFVIDEATSFAHGLGECPVGRFVWDLDLEGRARGIIEQMMPLQDRINQTVFDLLIAQTYGAFKQRYAAGMEGEPVMNADGTPAVDPETGQQLYQQLKIDPRRLWTSTDSNTRFGAIDETPLDGFIAALEAAIKQLAAISQVPPHALLGQMANLSAEALAAAEAQLMRMAQAKQKQWGATWSALFQLVAVALDLEGADDNRGQVRWADTSAKTFASVLDGLGKGAQMLDIPKRGLWHMFPGATDSTIERWKEMADEDRANAAEANPTALYARSLAAETSRRRQPSVAPKATA